VQGGRTQPAPLTVLPPDVRRQLQLGHQLRRQPGRPLLPDVGQLAFQGVGSRLNGGAQDVEERLARTRQGWLGGKVLLQGHHERHVRSAPLQFPIIVQLAVGIGGRIAGRQVEQNDFQDDAVPVGQPPGAIPQELFRRLQAARDGRGGEEVHEGFRQAGDPLLAQLPSRPGQPLRQHARILFLAITPRHEAQGIDDQPQDEQLLGPERGWRAGGTLALADLVGPVRQLAQDGQIRLSGRLGDLGIGRRQPEAVAGLRRGREA
jgi:hypothetical protein